MKLLKRVFGGGKADAPILPRDRSRPNEIPDAALDLMIRERLRGDEIIYHWSELRRGEVSILLISERLNRVCERIAAQCDPNGEFGREGGRGRSLDFIHQDGVWVFQGEGEWIS